MRNNAEYELPIDDIDAVIHQPARLKIMLYLYMVDSADFVYLMHKTGLSKGNLSSHLSKLEEAGYVTITKQFVDRIPRTLMTMTDAGRVAFDQYKKDILTLLGAIETTDK